MVLLTFYLNCTDINTFAVKRTAAVQLHGHMVAVAPGGATFRQQNRLFTSGVEVSVLRMIKFVGGKR